MPLKEVKEERYKDQEAKQTKAASLSEEFDAPSGTRDQTQMIK